MAFEWLRKIWLFFWPVSQSPIQEPEPKPSEEVDKNSDDAIKNKVSLKKDLLNDLPLYFVFLKRMRHRDPQAYHVYRTVGAHIIRDDKRIVDMSHERVSAWWAHNRPGFGCSAVSLDDSPMDKDRAHLKFWHFQKFTICYPDVQRPPDGWDIYVVTLYWDRPEWCKKHGVLDYFPVAISPDGLIKPLKIRQVIYHKPGFGRVTWQLPPISWSEIKDRSVPEQLCMLANALFSHWEACQYDSMFQVRAKKDNVTAIFTIPEFDTPYFFRERIKVMSGSRATPIFHCVRAHERVGGSAVRMHFRGLKRFNWRGYDIEISVPGKDYRPLSEFDGGSYDQDSNVKGMSWVAFAQRVEKLRMMRISK